MVTREAGREYNLVRLISIVSSSGTFVNREQTSKEHITDFIVVLVSLHPVHKSEGVLDCELIRGDRFKDVDKKRSKIIVVCVY